MPSTHLIEIIKVAETTGKIFVYWNEKMNLKERKNLAKEIGVDWSWVQIHTRIFEIVEKLKTI